MKSYSSRTRKILASAAVIVFSWLTPLIAPADILYSFGTNLFSGDNSRATNTPHLTALFQDVSTGHVRLTLSAPGLTNNENVDKLYFNLNPADNPTSLIFSNFTVAHGSFAFPAVDEGADAYKSGSDGYFDIRLNFGGSGLPTWFSQGDVMVCDLVGIPTLTAADFVYLSAPSGSSVGPFNAAVHLVSIFNPNGHGDTSGFVGAVGPGPDVEFVPEPTVNGLWVLATSLWVGFRWSRRSARAARA
jgi:hypothetical protein